MYINIENTGKFPLHYFFRLIEHPSVMYMTKLWPAEVEKKKPIATEALVKKKKPSKSMKNDKYASFFFNSIEKVDRKLDRYRTIYIYIYMYRSLLEPEKIVLGPMTITKLEGDVDVGEMDSVAINCYPEFVGSQDEQIVLIVPDTIPEEKDGKIITLSVTSSIPCIDFENLEMIFRENHMIERIQDFDCPFDVRIFSFYQPFENTARNLVEIDRPNHRSEFLTLFPPDRPAHRVRASRAVPLLPAYLRAEYSHGLFQVVQLRYSAREPKHRAHRGLVATR